jgi:hypothetical protein
MTFVASAIVGVGVVGAGLAAGSSAAGNAAIGKAAKEQSRVNALWAAKNEAIKQESNKNMSAEINSQLGAQLSNLLVQAQTAKGQLAVKSTESNIYGNTAARQQNMVQMQAALSKDNLIQAAEAKLLDVQNRASDLKYETESSNAQNAQSYNNAMSQQQSTLGIISGAFGAGLSAAGSAASLGSAFKAANAPTPAKPA